MLLKVLVYACLSNIYSGRRIEKALQENIHFMWLSGKLFPDFRTINNFRTERLKGHIQKIFSEIVFMLAEMGLVDLHKIAYTDGTKIEANANRYTFVWRGTVNYQKSRLEKRLKTVLKEIEASIKMDSQTENKEELDAQKIDSEFIEQRIAQINQKLKAGKHIDEHQKKTTKESRKD